MGKSDLVAHRQQSKTQMIEQAKLVMEQEHRATLKRKSIIERRKEHDEIQRANIRELNRQAKLKADEEAKRNQKVIEQIQPAPETNQSGGEDATVAAKKEQAEPARVEEPEELTEAQKAEQKRRARIEKMRLRESRHLDHLTRAIREASIQMWSQYDEGVAERTKEYMRKKFVAWQKHQEKEKQKRELAFQSVSIFAEDVAAFADAAVAARKAQMDERTRQ